MYVKVINANMCSQKGVHYNINEVHKQDYFCDSAFATLEYVDPWNVSDTTFLEVIPLGPFDDMGDGHSFVGDINIIRIIPIEELIRSDDWFARKYSSLKAMEK